VAVTVDAAEDGTVPVVVEAVEQAVILETVEMLDL
jgi:hypothetical protein